MDGTGLVNDQWLSLNSLTIRSPQSGANNQEKWRNTSRVCVYQTDCETPAAAGADESHQVTAAAKDSLGGRGATLPVVRTPEVTWR